MGHRNPRGRCAGARAGPGDTGRARIQARQGDSSMKRALFFSAAVALAGCDDMSVQPKQKAYSPLVGPVQLPAGIVEHNDRPVQAPPVTLALLERGQERY